MSATEEELSKPPEAEPKPAESGPHEPGVGGDITKPVAESAVTPALQPAARLAHSGPQNPGGGGN